MLIPPSIDDMIPAEHKVRNLEEVLFNLDWSDWESEYNLERGQPPIHPRLIAGAILYGLTERVRSSRDLEKACSFRTDFMWLLSGRKIDHSTFANFRTRFTDQLHKLFKQVTLVALQGKVKIDLAIDGTRIRANSSRSGALTEKRIKKRAAEVEEDLKRNSPRYESFIMPEIIQKWGVEDNGIYIIEFITLSTNSNVQLLCCSLKTFL